MMIMMITMNMVIGNRFFEGFFRTIFREQQQLVMQLIQFLGIHFVFWHPVPKQSFHMFGSITSGKHLHADECGTWEKCCKIARWQTLPQRNQQCLKPPKPFNKWKRKPNIVFRSVCAFRNHIFFCEQTKCLRFNLCEWYTNDLHQSVRDCNGLLHIEAVGFPTETFCPIPIVRVPPMSCFGFGTGNVPFHP